MKKRVLVYPCGTEIGLEIYRSVCNSIHFELIGGSSTKDHGSFVYKERINDLPFITDDSDEDEIKLFNELIKNCNIDYIYPAMDGVLFKFAQYKYLFSSTVIAPSYDVAKITRSKNLTYDVLADAVAIPKRYQTIDSVEEFPVFVKPDVGQGSVGAKKINTQVALQEYCSQTTKKTVVSEYLEGEEYTVDCFTNANGELIYANGRQRNRIKNGISVNCVEKIDNRFYDMARSINDRIKNVGGWFFQVKENSQHAYVLMEVSSRIAGTSAFCRCMGVNLPLLTLFTFAGNIIDSVEINTYNSFELDRALYNGFKIDMEYDTVYVDFDDTIYIDGKINTQLICYLFQCLNNHIALILITKHQENIYDKLKKLRILDLFDEILHIEKNEDKYKYIKKKNAIFIDDSFHERLKIKQEHDINVFDTHMIECLIDGGTF
jgi:predicted ATP-grasp superfamily ATP-dependent carboligase